MSWGVRALAPAAIPKAMIMAKIALIAVVKRSIGGRMLLV